MVALASVARLLKLVFCMRAAQGSEIRITSWYTFTVCSECKPLGEIFLLPGAALHQLSARDDMSCIGRNSKSTTLLVGAFRFTSSEGGARCLAHQPQVAFRAS